MLDSTTGGEERVVAQPNISGYTIADLLGSGGFASVYLATDDETGRQAAIKVLHAHTSQPDDLRRFERERMSLRALSGHPNIVGVYDSGETTDGQHYTALEYIDGGSVRDRITEGGALHWADAVEIGVQICAALDVAHRSGVLHRDVKPANILLDDDRAKLSDFGIARLVGQSQVTAAQSIIGTLAYTPPEVFHNKPFDGRGDIYQLGISLYEMLLGRAPFTSAAADNKATIIRRILDNPAPPLAQFDIPQPLSDLLDEVLAKDPADRPQSAETFGLRLNDVEVQMGRTPTEVGAETSTIVAETSTILIDTGETQLSKTSGEMPTVAITPEPPVIEPPADSDITVAEPRPANATSVLSPPEEPPLVDAPPRVSVATNDAPEAAPLTVAASASVLDEPQTPEAQDPAPRKPRRWPWVVAFLLFAGAVGGSVYAWQVAAGSDDDGPEVNIGEDDDDLIERDVQFAALESPAFAEPEGTDGVIFASVANSFGLTIVGGAGNGEAASQQRSVVWTIGPVDGETDIRLRADFADGEGLSSSNQRLLDIAVIDRQQMLAVGENQGGGGTNGIAWLGDRAGLLRPANDASFQTSARESLRGAAGDAANEQFIVVGSRGAGNNLVMGLWTVEPNPDWETPLWSPFEVGRGADGVLSDVAVEGEIAAAVGHEMIDGDDAAVILIRRGDTWSDLITPVPDSTFHSVTIAGDRIIAVGEKSLEGNVVPFAVVTNSNGEGFIHNLPIRGTTGIARSIGVVDGDRVIAVGDVEGDSDRDGAVWELLPGDDFGQDKWTTRATPDLQTDGFTELWAIDEFDGVVYVFGRTETDDRRPAGAWTLTLE